MMSQLKFVLIATAFVAASIWTSAVRAKEKESSRTEAHDEHETEEGSGSVGPEKGILEASAEDGFKLSPVAQKNLNIKMLKLSGPGPWTIPASARLLSGEEINLYRFRDGHFKRIDFSQLKRAGNQITVTSTSLRAKDEIALTGIGLLRMAELTAFGGAPEGHSH